ncbi:hypothetical protein FNF27_01384 [Cafeteria roenbergensis]|uniref:Protein farnesyltransferase/geranylgeranyltransferase type-1 subunit alpha n=1 Tax=Cafeteria roenbergensis TaxID=33653 RepID=A0A5A8EIE2_CAFRO|nr:hypothetical protein FNF27_01384 [Cafeteria roenbergensis]
MALGWTEDMDEVWADTEPLPLDEEGDSVVRIDYSPAYRRVMGTLRAVLASGETSERALRLTEAAIEASASFYSAWLHRRKCLRALKMDPLAELDVTCTWVGSNPKNFQFWQHHRALSIEAGPAAAASELAFTARVLNVDAKNYHAWGHRHFVLQALVKEACARKEPGAAPWEAVRAAELAWIDSLIASDPRNNSAWVHRWFVVDLDAAEAAVARAESVPGALRPPSHCAVAYADKAGATVKQEQEWAIDCIRGTGVLANESAFNYLRALGSAARTRARAEQVARDAAADAGPAADAAQSDSLPAETASPDTAISGAGFDAEALLQPTEEFLTELAGRAVDRLRSASGSAEGGAAEGGKSLEPLSPFVASFVVAALAEWREEQAAAAIEARSQPLATRTASIKAAIAALEDAALQDPTRQALWSARATTLREVATGAGCLPG